MSWTTGYTMEATRFKYVEPHTPKLNAGDPCNNKNCAWPVPGLTYELFIDEEPNSGYFFTAEVVGLKTKDRDGIITHYTQFVKASDSEETEDEYELREWDLQTGKIKRFRLAIVESDEIDINDRDKLALGIITPEEYEKRMKETIEKIDLTSLIR